LNEAREQLRSISEVLRAIGSSPGKLEPIFKSMLANAVHICEANFGILLLYDGDHFSLAAAHNPPPAHTELRRRQPEIRSPGILARVVATKQVLHIADCTEDTAYRQGDTDFVAFVDLCSARTLLCAPLLREGELIGIIGVLSPRSPTLH
jgi:GAF domain-containing protein